MKKFLRTLPFLVFLAIFSGAFVACSDGDSGGNDSPRSEATATAYTGTFSVGSTAYKTLQMMSDGTYSLKGDSGNDSGTYTVSTESRSVSNGTYMFYSKQTYNGKFFYVVVSDTGIVLQSGTVDASGTGTLGASSNESSESNGSGESGGENKGNIPGGNEQAEEENTVDFSDALSYTVTVSEFAAKIAELRESRAKKAIFVITDAKNDTIPTVGASVKFDLPCQLDLSQSSELTEIKENTFNHKEGLYGITLPTSLTSIGKWAFRDCNNLQSITIPENVTRIESSAFDGCASITSINIPNLVTSLGNNIFKYCSKLEKITIGTGLNSTSFATFNDEGLESLTEIIVADENETFTSVDGVLYKKDLKTLVSFPCGKAYIDIPSSVTTLSEGAFYYATALKTLIIPDSVQNSDGFPRHCPKLASITIGKGFGGGVGGIPPFYGCPNLTSITVSAENQYIKSENNAVYSKDGKKLYAVAGGITEFSISDTTEEICKSAFSGCVNLTSIVIPDSVTTIGEGAFSGCTNLSEVTLGNGLTEFGRWFSTTPSLKSITIPRSITKITQYVLLLTSLTSVTFEDTESIWYTTTENTYTNGTEMGAMSSSPAENVSKLTGNAAKYWYNSKLNTNGNL